MKSARTYSTLIAFAAPVALAVASGTAPFGRLDMAQVAPEQIQARLKALQTYVASTPDPLIRVDRGLRAALDLLGEPLAPAATRFLLDRAEPGDTEVVASATRAAIGLLDHAQATLATLDRDADEDEPDTWMLALDLDATRAMADALAAIGPVNGMSDSDRDAALQEAAAGLVIVLEDDRPNVVAAAKLWLAQIYLQRGLGVRAVQILPDVLQSPAEESAHAFAGSWLRCRQLAEDPKWLPATLALSARLAEQCRPWFENSADSDRAERTAALLHRQLLARWESELNTAGQASQAAWCREAIEKVDATYFALSQELLPLDTAIPPIRDTSVVAEHLAQLDAAANAPATRRAAEPVPAGPMETNDTATEAPAGADAAPIETAPNEADAANAAAAMPEDDTADGTPPAVTPSEVTPSETDPDDQR